MEHVAERGPLATGVTSQHSGKLAKIDHDILQNFITCAKEINCFRIPFAC